MEESQKKSSSAVNSKEKNDMLDLDIGKDDFLSSWKPEGDTLDFDFGPVSKGNKKPFQFDKSSMDFNMDDDFGMPSFDMNMSDLDISPPLKKDGPSKEKSKETSGGDKGKAERKLPSFDMDMPDLDISPPLRKDGKSNEKSKELSGGKKNGKADQFDFGFDFNEMDDFNFDPTPPKDPKGPKAQIEKNSLENVDVERSLTKEGSEAKEIKENLVENVDFGPTLGKADSKTQNEEHNTESLKIFDTNLSLAKEGSKAPKDKCGIDCMEYSNFESSLAKEGSMIRRDEDIVQVTTHLNFERSFREDGPEIQQDKDDIGSSPYGTQCQVMDDSPQVDLIGCMNFTEDVPPNPSLPETMITFDNDCQISGALELETRRNFPLKVAIDDSAISKCSAAAEEVSSDKARILPQDIASSAEFSKSRPVDRSICLKPVELEVCTGNDADASSDSLTNYELYRGISEVPDKGECTRSIGEQDANVIPLSGSANIDKLMKLDSSECLQRVEITQENSMEKSQCKLENHVKNNKARTGCSQVNSVAENSCITGGVPGILSDSPVTTKNKGTTLEIPKLSSISQLPDKLSANKAMEKGREPPITLSRFFIQSENLKGHVQEASSTQPTDSPLSNKMKGSTQCSLIDGKRNRDRIQRDRSTGSLPLMHTSTHFMRKLPQKQKQNQESFMDLKTCGVVLDSAKLQSTKKYDDSLVQNHEMVKGTTAQSQRESRLRDVDTVSLSTSSMVTKEKTAENDMTLITSASLSAMKSNSVEKKNISESPNPSSPKHLSNCATPPSLSVETKKKTAQRNRVHTPLAALPVTKNTPDKESSKTPNSLGLKLSSLKLGLTKPQNLLNMKLAGNISQKGLRSSQISSPDFAVSQKHSPSTASLKRKALVEHNRNTTVLYPSKRISQSPTESRNFADEAIRLLDKKVSNRKNVENDCSKNTLGNCQVPNVDDIQHKMDCKGPEISTFVENNSNIKHAEAYSRKLDDISNEMRKIYEDAKELLVRATVNSNKLLMLNPFLLDQKIHTVRNSFARFTLNGI